MAEQGRETRSPNSITSDQPHNRRGEIRQGGPFQRADSDATPPKPRAGQNSDVVGMPRGVTEDKGRRF